MIFDKYLKTLHEEAGKDFDKGDDTAGKDADDKIGRIHDNIERIRQLLEQHLISKEQAEVDEKGEAESEQEKVEQDRKEE